MPHAIQSIQAREILDSRGFPTVEVALTLQTGACGVACVPSGASTGSAEALELRDGDAKRYMGKGVLQAVRNVTQVIAPTLVDQCFDSFKAVDDCMIQLDGTSNKSVLGANAILAVSLACAKAMAQAEQMPLYRYVARHAGDAQPSLPVPLMNILNGGAHADNPLDFQEFMIVPAGFDHFAEALRAGVEIFHALKSILKQAGLSVAIGDEGGFAPDVRDHDEAAAWVLKAIEAAGYRPGKDVYLALDVASTEFYQDDHYRLHCEGKIYTSAQMVERLQAMVRQYPIVSIEDGMAENDWVGWQLLTQTLGAQVQLVGDDLFVTNTAFLKRGIDDQAGNAILIKPNQIGSLSETLAAMTMAKAAHFNSIVSHRSGETEDTTIADVAVGVGAGQIKTGSLCRSERVAKYNRLLAIANDLGPDAVYAGRSVYNRWIGS